jgi:hypothetical protein
VTIPYLRRLVVGFLPRQPGFDPRSSHVGSVMDRATLGQVFFKYFGFSCLSFIPLIASQPSLSIIEEWYNRPLNGHSSSGVVSAAVQ